MTAEMHRVASIVLGGGQGTRLFPLTHDVPKPAIPFGGRYRLIDIPVSNSINAGICKIFVITQFLSCALHRHLIQTYRFDNFSSGFIEILTPEQRPNSECWFQGTADAVRQSMHYFMDLPVDYFLILSGDQLYNMDFEEMIQFAREKNADLTIASLPVDKENAHRMGILKIDEDANVQEFYEKPQEDELLQKLICDKSIFKKWNLCACDGSGEDKKYLGSMGIYVFKREALFKLLREDNGEDFGKHLIPKQINQGRVAAYLYQGYWEDIGTIKSFYEANMALTQDKPAFDCYDLTNPIYTLMNNLPGPKFGETRISSSIIGEGSIINADEISNSILGVRAVVKKDTIIRDSYIMGNDFYEPPLRDLGTLPENLEIQEECFIENAIIGRNCCIGKGVRLMNVKNLDNYDSEDGSVYIRDGIIIVPAGSRIPDGFVL